MIKNGETNRLPAEPATSGPGAKSRKTVWLDEKTWSRLELVAASHGSLSVSAAIRFLAAQWEREEEKRK